MLRDAYGRLGGNSYVGRHTLGPRPPGSPWYVHLADTDGIFRLLCFDFDGKDGGTVTTDLVEQAVDECDALSALMTGLALEHVVCQSSAGGGRHIWVALRDGVTVEVTRLLAGAARANYRRLDHGMLNNAREGGARPPLAPHRDGSNSTIVSGSLTALTAPSVTKDDLVALTAALEARKPAFRAENSPPSGPTDRAHRAHRALSSAGAAHMATVGGGSNPSWTGFMCLLSAAVAGWSLPDVERAAKTAPGMEHYRSKNTGRGTRTRRTSAEAEARLLRQWEKAAQYAALYAVLPPQREPADLTELQSIVATVDDVLARLRAAPGRWARTEAGTSQATVLQALAFLTLHTGKQTVAASIRDLALLAGVGRTTAATALYALTAAHLIEQVVASDGGNASEWRLTTHFSTASDTLRSQPLNNPRPPTELFNTRTRLATQLAELLTDGRHDLFTRQGLGHAAGKLYALLRNSPTVTVDTAARQLGISRRHATTILSRLRTHRLIIKHRDGWARSKQDLRTTAARALGVAGALVDRANAYRAEREVWAWWQAEHQTMTTAPRDRPKRFHVSSRLLFTAERPGERVWPRYPRRPDGLADHKEARWYVDAGALNPERRWQLVA